MENEAGPTPKPPTHAECTVGVSVEGCGVVVVMKNHQPGEWGLGSRPAGRGQGSPGRGVKREWSPVQGARGLVG